jgi:glycosyltransferase involved in cell wall biosynthesis
MKILFLSDDFPPESFGGAGISTYDLAIGMKGAGHEVFVITTCREKNEVGETDYHGLKIYKVASDYPRKWRWYLSLYNPNVRRQVEEILRIIRPDVVHINNVHLYLSYYCFKLAKRYARSVVFTARDVMTFNFSKLNTERYLKNFDAHTTWLDHLKQAKKRWNPFRNFFIRRYLSYADQIFSVSFALKKALLQNGIKNVEVTHSGVDVMSWQVSEEERNRFREKYNIKDKKVVLFGGRLSGAKGSKQVLDAMAIVREAVFLIVASSDASTDWLEAEAQKMGFRDRLVFTGWVDRDEIKYIYSCADLVLVPSICLDAFPRIVIEAMAAGKPVIGTCYGGASEAIIDGETGYIINPFDTAKMAEKILDLLKNPKKAEQFGWAGRMRVENLFNIKDKIHQIIFYYQKIINKKLK